jgi:molybdopterin synthase catalytic subunit
VGEEPLALEPLIAAVSGPGHGGVACFLGVVRAEGDVVALDYEAYPAMAVRQMAAIADALRAEFGPLAVACAHRVGRLDAGVPSLALAVGAPHRREAFAAAAAFVDRLKARVPIWKRDLTADERSET